MPQRLIKHNAMKANGKVEVWLHTFLTSAIEEVNVELHAPVAVLPGYLWK